MRIVIIGAGEVGREIARQMAEEKKDVVLIEKNPERVKEVTGTIDVTVLQGEGTNLDVLKEAGVENADMFIATTSSDEINLVSCFLVAAEYRVPLKIARVRNVQYSESRAFNTRLSGVDYLVNPEQEAAIDILQTVEQGAESPVTIFDNIDVQLREYNVEEDSYVANKSLKDIRIGLKEQFLITGVVRNGELTIPQGDFVLLDNDRIYIVAHKKTFRSLSNIFGVKTNKLRKILIVGGTNIGVSVAEMLIARGRSVVMIDKDYDRCKELAEILPEALVLNGDITDNQLRVDEDIAAMDAIVSCTTNEELNILSGLYIKTLGVKRAVALVEKTSYLSLAKGIGINSTVSPKSCAINSILKYIRKGGVNSIHSVFDGNAEAIEVVLSEKSLLINEAVKDVPLPEGCLIAAITRFHICIIPNGNFVLKAHDNVIFFVLRTKITEFEQMMS